MAAPRKTIPVRDIVSKVNEMCANLPDGPGAVEARTALTVLAESVMHATGNYRGFQFADGNNGDTDPSKRTYYLGPS